MKYRYNNKHLYSVYRLAASVQLQIYRKLIIIHQFVRSFAANASTLRKFAITKTINRNITFRNFFLKQFHDQLGRFSFAMTFPEQWKISFNTLKCTFFLQSILFIQDFKMSTFTFSEEFN